jgi:hypothetical protein
MVVFCASVVLGMFIGVRRRKQAEAPKPVSWLGSCRMWRTLPEPLSQSVVPKTASAGMVTASLGSDRYYLGRSHENFEGRCACTEQWRLRVAFHCDIIICAVL